jgi:hypothetical protein
MCYLEQRSLTSVILVCGGSLVELGFFMVFPS